MTSFKEINTIKKCPFTKKIELERPVNFHTYLFLPNCQIQPSLKNEMNLQLAKCMQYFKQSFTCSISLYNVSLKAFV